MTRKIETTPPDIVARLRAVDHMSVEDCFLQSHLFAGAADEIEALRRELRRAGQWDEYHPAYIAGAKAAFWHRDNPAKEVAP